MSWLLIKRTPAGFEIRAAGSNLRALEVQGTNSSRVILMVMLISGALAGLAGMSEVYGVHYRREGGRARRLMAIPASLSRSWASSILWAS